MWYFCLKTDTIATLALKVKPSVHKHIKSGHPWLFESSIVKQNKPGESGDLAILFDNKHNKFLALGLYDPDSPIRVKILTTKNGTRLDQEWFDKKFSNCLGKRETLLLTDTTAYRLCFGENDSLPSLICDVYEDVAVLKIYSRIWFPFLVHIKQSILKVTSCKTIVLRLSRNVQQNILDGPHHDGQILEGSLDSEVVTFKEHGVKFNANVIRGHKTGFFLDHRHNRLKVQHLAKEKTVLDVFSYAGGFAVHALKGGAREVSCLDLSKQALNLAKENALLNNPQAEFQVLQGDAFKLLTDLTKQGLRYDLVIIDPPAFAKAAKEVETALNQYQRLALLGINLVSHGGILVLASCSSRVSADDFYEHIEQGMSKSKRKFKLQEKTFHDIDHPIGFAEGAYLKCGYYSIG